MELSMSSTSRKYYYHNKTTKWEVAATNDGDQYYYHTETTKWEVAATNAGGVSFPRNAAKNKSKAPEGTARTTPMLTKKEPPKEKPVSKSDDLLMHGVKPWDPDADDFHEALVEARRKIDAQQDQDHSKTDSLTGWSVSNWKWEGPPIGVRGSSSNNSGKNKNNNVPKATSTKVKEQPKEAPISKHEDRLTYGVKEQPKEALISKYEDRLTYGVKPWDSDADDFLVKIRGKFESCQIEDYEIDTFKGEDSDIDKWEDKDSETNAYQDEDSDY